VGNHGAQEKKENDCCKRKLLSVSHFQSIPPFILNQFLEDEQEKGSSQTAEMVPGTFFPHIKKRCQAPFLAEEFLWYVPQAGDVKDFAADIEAHGTIHRALPAIIARKRC
jgi:hypothetical protein